MIYKTFAFYALLFAAFFLNAAEKTEKFVITEGPYLQKYAADEATVVWTTNRPSVSWVETAPDDSTHFYAQERPKTFNSPMGKKQIGTVHFVKLSNLKTPVRYRIISQEVVARNGIRVDYGDTSSSKVYNAEPFLIKPMDNSVKKVKFAVVNDIHADSQTLRNLLAHAPVDINFLVLNGDMVSSMESEAQIFKGFMHDVAEYAKGALPIYFVRGNHESRGEFSESFMQYFPTVTGSPYYSFKWGSAYFVCLDTGEDKPDSDIEYYGTADFDNYRKAQAEWFKKLMQTPEFKNAPIKIVIVHVPPSWGGWHGSLHFRNLFRPLFNEAGIDIILSAHLHKNVFYPAGTAGFNAPNIVNSNNELMTIEADTDKIDITFTDVNGKQARDKITLTKKPENHLLSASKH